MPAIEDNARDVVAWHARQRAGEQSLGAALSTVCVCVCVCVCVYLFMCTRGRARTDPASRRSSSRVGGCRTPSPLPGKQRAAME
jgi:hypothetical protein